MKKIFMPLMTLALGAVLMSVGIASNALQNAETAHWTALIPAFIGGIFLILGGMAMSPRFRMHTIHGALVLALILGLYCIFKIIGMLIDLGDLKTFSFSATGAACVAYIILAVRSFKQARQARKDAAVAVKAAEKAEAAAER
ncbi:MAG: hypothetical protein AAF086_07880 [Planctomycetota bacterium]